MNPAALDGNLMMFGINKAGDHITELNGLYHLPSDTNGVIDFVSDDGPVWSLFNVIANEDYGIEIDGKAYYMARLERAEAFIERIGGKDMLNRQHVEYHNNKMMEAIDNL